MTLGHLLADLPGLIRREGVVKVGEQGAEGETHEHDPGEIVHLYQWAAGSRFVQKFEKKLGGSCSRIGGGHGPGMHMVFI